MPDSSTCKEHLNSAANERRAIVSAMAPDAGIAQHAERRLALRLELWPAGYVWRAALFASTSSLNGRLSSFPSYIAPQGRNVRGGIANVPVCMFVKVRNFIDRKLPFHDSGRPYQQRAGGVLPLPKNDGASGHSAFRADNCAIQHLGIDTNDAIIPDGAAMQLRPVA